MANALPPPETLKAPFESNCAHYAERLAPYKRPVRIEFRDALPKSPPGKVLHRTLKPAA
jgi:acyl-CoA synthetase (AMP-forming)/AMP-acid ligase II